MIFLRLFGASALLVCALMIGRLYSSYLDGRLSEYRGLVALISHAEEKIERSLSFGGELWRDFRDDVMEKCGLLPLLRGGKGLADSFRECMGNFSLPAGIKAEISEALSTLGRGYRDSEMKRLAEIKTRLTEELSSESLSAEKNKRVVNALLIGGALTVGILII